MKQYKKTKDSGIKWIGEIPEEWRVKRLKFISKFDLSSVDRHQNEGELQVLVCHYPEVYNNEKITKATVLSDGVCNPKEFEKFRLKKDDILITKDSETPDDIGVPAYVEDDIKNVVCGYHLAQLSTYKNQILGNFLFRFLQSNFANAYFETCSNGVTRFGLGKDSIGNITTPLPSIIEQKQIADFLDKETSKIDSEIQKNQKLIELLKEKRQATINQTVTKGLDPTVPMKESGIEWIGDIPKHWKISKFRIAMRKKEIRNDDNKMRKMLSVSQYLGIIKKEYESAELIKTKDESLRYLVVGPHDLVVNVMWLQYRGLGVSFLEGIVSPDYRIFKISTEIIHPVYLNHLVRSDVYLNEYPRHLRGIRPNSSRISSRDFLRLPLLLPPYEEQKQISHFINHQTSKIDSLISKTETQIEKLQEYRLALISAAVTGKIDVRQEVIAQ